MRFLRPLLALLVIASCVPGPTVPAPNPDLPTAPPQYSVQPIADQRISAAATVSLSSEAMRRRAGKKWPWIVAGVVVVAVVIIIVASSGGSGGLGY